tara:strand:+ start:310 stop:945 length:636 start_codon:yes stop_codon:yes gene_type:complete
MTKIQKILIISVIFNFCFSAQAQDAPKNYLKGKFYASVKNLFLVATENMTDPRFKNTVIVMIESDENGAWGLVINKQLASIPLGSLIYKSRDSTIKQKKLYKVNIPVYWGGPVNENKIIVLHSNDYKNDTTKNYTDISISTDYKILFDIADSKGPKKSLILIGVSSWGEGQLEGEMEREGWVLSEVNLDLIFEMENSKKWPTALNNSFVRL